MDRLSNSKLCALLETFREGSSLSNEALWNEVRDYLMIIANQKLHGGLQSKFDASDIVQQTLIEVQRDLNLFQGDGKALRAWLRRLVENNVKDSSRRYSQTQKRDVTKEINGLDASSHAGLDLTASLILQKGETEQQLWLAVQSLSERDRQVIELRHQHEMNFKDIANELGTTEAAARQTYSRSLKKLKSKLSAHDDM